MVQCVRTYYNCWRTAVLFVGLTRCSTAIALDVLLLYNLHMTDDTTP